jgi:DNA primase
MKRIPQSELRRLRNEIDIASLIERLGLVAKWVEGVFRFLCPRCNEFHTATNPRTNLARCFRCAENFNPIELVMAVRHCPFLEAVAYLQDQTDARRQIAADIRRR